MKNISILIITLTLCSTLSTHAYEFSFYNNTKNPIGIAIQFTGNDGGHEPLYTQLVKPKSMVTFTPGKIGIPDIKWGFCLDKIHYVENPTPAQKMHHFAKAPWRKVAVTWVEEKSATKKKPSTKKTPAASSFAKASKDMPAAKQILTEKESASTTLAEKSLCRDRHFDIIYDEHQKIAITSSLNE
jgi:hypothetical protein